MKTLVIIPAYNEAKTIAQAIEEVLAVTPEVVVINDGSTDRTAEIAARYPVTVLNHFINRGLGAALGTGLAYATSQDVEAVATLDADGQHRASDLPRLLEPIKSGQADVVIGSRLIEPQGMPWHRRLNNKAANLLTWLLFGYRVSDSQSGYRLFSKAAAAQLELKTNHMEVSSEIIQEIKRHDLRLTELPIEAIYTDYSLSKGQNFLLGLKTVFKLVLKRIAG